MKVTDIKDFQEKTVESIEQWAYGKIDEMTGKNPRLLVAGKYAKKGLHNYLNDKLDEINGAIETASMFLKDEDGSIDTSVIVDDFISMFEEMEEVEFNYHGMRGTIGKGAFRIAVPQNIFFKTMFGDIGAFRITTADLSDLKEMLA